MTEVIRTYGIDPLRPIAGLLLGKGGFHGNVIRISPPMSLTEAESDEGLQILGECLKGL